MNIQACCPGTFMCLAYRSQLMCVECIFFFCITSKSLTLLHIHTLYCILVHLLLIVIITTITIALVLKNKVFFFLVWHREFRNWHRDGPGMSRATEIWYLGMQSMAPGGSLCHGGKCWNGTVEKCYMFW